MFERFDDPEGFRPGPDLRAGVRQRGRRIRRRRRLAAAGLSGLVVLAGAFGAGALYVERRDGAIDRVDVSTPAPVDGVVNILLVGTDSGIADGARADSIAVLRLDETGSHLLSIPRDLYDEATGGRVNLGFDVGGAQGVIDAVERTTGIPVNHYVAMDPDGFVDLVDAAGGLELQVLRPIRDAPTGLELAAGSCTTLDGNTALALARARHAEVQFEATGWTTDPRGDLGRIARQRLMLGAALDQLDPDPATLDRLGRLLADHAVVDDGLDLNALVRIGTRIAGGPALVTEQLPVLARTLPSGAAVLDLGPGAEDVVASYGGPSAPAGAPGVEGDGSGPSDFDAIAPCP
jgi:LCP family protein required for cell wall assembly